MPEDPASEAWNIPGAADQPILGTTHLPSEDPIGVVLIVHGFLGYKDYGMSPMLADRLARAGVVAHRFNLSHSGMTEDTSSFQRPDLFEKDTWNTQVFDIDAVVDAVHTGQLAGRGLPLVLLGHSRGGVSVILSAGRRFRDDRQPLPRGIITLAAPDTCCSWDADRIREVIERGYESITSNRTGQTLRIGAGWIREQIDNPRAHDPLSHAADIRCPMLVVHGQSDQTVPASAARAIADAAQSARIVVIPGASHVFDTSNPTPIHAEPSAALGQVIDETKAFIAERCGS